MIYADTASENVFFNFGCELLFAGERDPGEDVFLLWRTAPTLMIGKYQNALEEIDVSYAKEKNITVVRRFSGGGTIYTDRGSWQFSHITRSAGREIDFGRFMDPVVGFLRSLGLPAEKTGRNDIAVDGKKISGNAQFKMGSATVHHGSLLFDADLGELVRASTPKPYKITSKAIRSVRDRVTNIRAALAEHHLPDLTAKEFRDRLAAYVSDGVYLMTEEDRRRAGELGESHFNDPAALWSAVPRFGIEKTIHTPGGTFEIGLTVKKGIIEAASVRGDFFSGAGPEADPAAVLRGIPYTPDAVERALLPFEGTLYETELKALADGLFE